MAGPFGCLLGSSGGPGRAGQPVVAAAAVEAHCFSPCCVPLLGPPRSRGARRPPLVLGASLASTRDTC